MPLEFIARRYDTGALARVEIAADRIVRLHVLPEAADRPAAGTPAPWVAPGFVDVQVNGWNGQEFSSQDLTPEKVARVTREHDPFGVTGYCPTLTTQSYECLSHGLAT